MVFQHFFDPTVFGIELIFTVIAVVFCFVIYFKTREIYELTKHEGIMYFRTAFLFFGLSYLVRFLFSLLIFSQIAFDFILPRSIFFLFFIFLLGYFSTIGIFYLISSLIWKRFNGRKLLVVGHGIAVILSITSLVTRSHEILLGLQTLLLLVAGVSLFFGQKKERRVSQIKILYLLVAALWIINLLVIGRIRQFSLWIEFPFYVLSLFVFIVIYYKISKWVK